MQQVTPEVNTQPTDGVNTSVNTIPGQGNEDFVKLYDPVLQSAVLVPTNRVDEAIAKHGYTLEEHNLDAAYDEYISCIDAAKDAVSKSFAEIVSLGYTRLETETIINQANGALWDAWHGLAKAIGAVVPTEHVVESVAAHFEKHGSLDNLANMSRFKDVALKYHEQNKDAVMNHLERSQSETAQGEAR